MATQVFGRVRARVLVLSAAGLLCACARTHDGRSLERFARAVHSAGAGYSGPLSRDNRVVLARYGLCEANPYQPSRARRSVVNNPPRLGVTSREVSSAVGQRSTGFYIRDDDAETFAAVFNPVSMWRPCRAERPYATEVPTTPPRPRSVTGQIRVGATHIELAADVSTFAHARVTGPNQCVQLILRLPSRSLEVALSEPTPPPAARTATLTAEEVDALEQATHLQLCDTTHVLVRSQRASLHGFATSMRQLAPEPGRFPSTTAGAGTQHAVLSKVAALSGATVSTLTITKSMVLAVAGSATQELWQIEAPSGASRYVIVLTRQHDRGDGVRVFAETERETDVIDAGRAALTHNEYARAAWILEPAAERGNPDAQVAVGAMHLAGLGVERSTERAVALFLLAAASQHPKAEFNLAVLYDQGNGVPQDKAQALQWARLAAEHGHAAAHSFVGSFYALGDVVEQDWAQAEAWYRRAVEAGDPEGSRRLGLMHAEGQGVTRDAVTALRWYRRSAEMRWPPGVAALAHAYEVGLGTAANPQLARQLYEQAHHAGFDEASFRLALLLIEGRGGPVDEARGRALIEHAASRGHAAANAYLQPTPSPPDTLQ